MPFKKIFQISFSTNKEMNVIEGDVEKMEPLFLYFFPIRANQYRPSLSTKQENYYVPIPKTQFNDI